MCKCVCVCVCVWAGMQGYLQLQHQVQPVLAQGIDGIDDKCDDDVNAIGFVLGYAGLKKMETVTMALTTHTNIKTHSLSHTHTLTLTHSIELSPVAAMGPPSTWVFEMSQTELPDIETV